jgi:Icc-related predicted phosphoesterase
MPRCVFATDIHGRPDRYEKLFHAIERRAPDAVFLGGDLTPSPMAAMNPSNPLPADFIGDYLSERLERIRRRMADRYPDVFVILGNDDHRSLEPDLMEGDRRGLWTYCHNRSCELDGYDVYGYAFVPPSPFLLKDWERYDVSRYVPPGCVSPEEGRRSVEVDPREVQFGTIGADLAGIVGGRGLERAVMLFHTPPHDTVLDRVANDNKFVEHVPLDLHVGSIAVRRFIETRQPLVTMHGHIHESARLTGRWRERIGATHVFGAAHDGPELALVSFDLENLDGATRELL